MMMAAVATAALFIACPPPPPAPEPPPPLEGTYEGIYKYEKTGQPAEEQFIYWIFTPNSCFMDLDTLKQPEAERKFCDIEARYSVGDGINIYIPIVAGRDSSSFRNRTQKACDKDKGPFGRFQLDQSTLNKIVLTRVNTTDTSMQRITLTRISEEY
jgi:hypothetical protein